jgi:hypothetical protein
MQEESNTACFYGASIFCFQVLLIDSYSSSSSLFHNFTRHYARAYLPAHVNTPCSHGGDHPDLVNRRELFLEDFGTFKWKLAQRALPKPMAPGQFHQVRWPYHNGSSR